MRYAALLIAVLCLGAAAPGRTGSPDLRFVTDRNVFGVQPLKASPLDDSQVENIWALERDSNCIWYVDTLSEADTVRFAYRFAGDKWLSVTTPFAHTPYFKNYRFVDLDDDGIPELLVQDDILYQTWPRGHNIHAATVIFRLGAHPAIIFRCITGCDVLNLGRTPEYEDGLDMSVERTVEPGKGGLLIGRTDLSRLQKSELKAYRKFCAITSIAPGYYKLVNGRFRLQR